MEAGRSLNTQDKSDSRRQLANSSRTRWPPVIILVLLEKSHQRDLSSVFMTVGDAVTPWRPQFFRADCVGHGGPRKSERSRKAEHIEAESRHLVADTRAPVIHLALLTVILQQRNSASWC